MTLPSKEAVEYGRLVVGQLRDKLRSWEAKAKAEGDPEKERRMRFAAFMLERDLLGSEEGGCVIVAFDLRKLDDEWRAWYDTDVSPLERAISRPEATSAPQPSAASAETD